MNYEEVINELIGAKVTFYDEVFDYSNSELNSIFNRFFSFCQKSLIEDEINEIEIQPARFFFRNEYAVNAYATRGNGYYIIKINRGTVEILAYFFEEKESVFQNDKYEKLNELRKFIDLPPSYIMFQTAMLFTFYHERAHLIQKATISDFSFQESYINISNSAYSLSHHIYEMDADMFASHFCIMHLMQFWNLIEMKDRSTDKLISIFVIGLSSLIVYLILLMRNDYEIYYKEYDHPHMMVRLAYISDVMLRTIIEHANLDSILDQRKIVHDAIDLANFLFIHQNENRMENFAEIFLSEKDNINGYINFMIEKSKQYSNLAFKN
jgi:hypothetical protein